MGLVRKEGVTEKRNMVLLQAYAVTNFILQRLINYIRHLATRFRPETLNGPFSAVSVPFAVIRYSSE